MALFSEKPVEKINNRGLFISFEGVDGAGKTTHIEPLRKAFLAQGKTLLCSREPGGTPLAEELRKLLLQQRMDGLSEALLMFAARNEHVKQVIAPALARGEVVLCDRFADATFAYQGGGRGFDWQTLQALERMVLANPAGSADNDLLQPDLTLWFDLPAATALQRLSTSNRTYDVFESESCSFFDRVNQAYARRAAEAPHRIVRINANLPQDQVWQQIEQTLQQRGWL